MIELHNPPIMVVSNPIQLTQPAEVDRLERLIQARSRQEITDQFFLKARLQQGIYGIRGSADHFMVRVRVPLGRLTAGHLDQLGRIAGQYAGGKIHLTTRQDVQLYQVALADLPPALADLGEAGLTTRETSGNVVRNITADPLAGVAPDEAFDVWPYAHQTLRFFLRNPLTQNLPRKVKIAFSGSPADRAAAFIHDVGAIAVTRPANGQMEPGFRLYVGGGLGASPMLAQPLEDFTPAALLLPTLEAIVRIFDRLGERQNRNRARLKFLVETMGLNALRTAVLGEREVLRAVEPVTNWPEPGPDQPDFPPLPAQPLPQGNTDVNRWVFTNVIPQKQPGYAAVYLTVPGGDLTGDQLRGLARLTRAFARGEAVITISQNLVLRWVAIKQLPALYRSLAALGLHAPGAERLGNPVGCAGADTCPLAITTSHRLAQELARRWASRPEWWLSQDMAGITLKISGCPNACGHHHIAPIGLYGASRKIGGRNVPHYNLLLGGRVNDTGTRFGQWVARIPAKRVPEALEALLTAYRRDRRPAETFLDYVDRLQQAEQLKAWAGQVLQPFFSVDRPSDYHDWGRQDDFTIEIGDNECAA